MFKIKIPKIPKFFLAHNIQEIIDKEIKKREKILNEFYNNKIKNLTNHYESIIEIKEKKYIEQDKIYSKLNRIMRKNANIIQENRNIMMGFAHNIQNGLNNIIDFALPSLRKMTGDCEGYMIKAERQLKKDDIKISLNNNKSGKLKRKLKTIQENQLALPLIDGVNYDSIEKS